MCIRDRFGYVVYPLYGQHEGYGTRAAGSLIGPIGFTGERALETAKALGEGDFGKFGAGALRLTPVVGTVGPSRYADLIEFLKQ